MSAATHTSADTHHAPVRLTAIDLAAIGALLLMAVAIYRPDAPPPFDYVDFPENILTLKAHDGFPARFRALMDVYGEHGRFSPVTLSLLAAQWSWFDWWTPGWYLVRFTVMSGVTGLAYVLFRKLWLTPLGAFAGAALFVVSPPAVVGWTRLSTAEPIGALFLAIACLLAIRGGRGANGGMALMLLLVMWTKEITTASFLLPWYLALTYPRYARRIGVPARTWSRVVPSVAALALGSAPVLWTYLRAPSESFAGRYGQAGISPGEMLGSTLAAVLPFAPVVNGDRMEVLLVVSALLLLLLAGWHGAFAARDRRFQPGMLLLPGIGLAVIGALVYAPWPFYLLVYALPFMLGGAMLTGQAVSSLAVSSGLWRLVALLCITIVLSFSYMQAANEASRTRALHSAIATSVTRVATYSNVDTILVTVAPDQFDPRGNFGPRFWLYARALGLHWPPVRDVRCEQAPAAPASGILILHLSTMCPNSTMPQGASAYAHLRFRWPDPRPASDSVWVSLVELSARGVP